MGTQANACLSQSQLSDITKLREIKYLLKNNSHQSFVLHCNNLMLALPKKLFHNSFHAALQHKVIQGE
ncbi:hypothetical protein [Comamonas resistens]|uniref:Uncharacterized protein n=1 Tax=Comamonas resistens TaxID=3046670 RepID=A0ABY8SYI7_9BURK|nr:hypothetical protein [Comamonas resistens]MDL5036633.1 hypothetical protein [Comamonas resistens]WHS66949.1 hypothetical protein QMY55_07485 [Comamonas resistens]